MIDTVIVTDPATGRRTEMTVFDWEIVKKREEALRLLCEIERLQSEIHDLEIKQANLLR